MTTLLFVHCLTLSSSTFSNRRVDHLCSAAVTAVPGSRKSYRRALATPHACVSGPATKDLGLDGSSLDKEMKELEGTSLKWSEIVFPTIEDELRAIDEYVEAEEIADGDCWPIFLRACAYESRGQSQLALAQLLKVEAAEGLSKVPNLWERRGYNTFKVGNIRKASALFDVSQTIYCQALGNELHFSHWFEDNFEAYKPKHNGPAFSVQRGICKYCVGMVEEARNYLVSGIILRETGSDHAVLWLLASCARSSNEMSKACDMNVVQDFRKEVGSEVSRTLNLCIDLYCIALYAESANVVEIVDSLTEIAKGNNGDESLVAATYLALYHDSMTRNSEECDRWLDVIGKFSWDSPRTDTLDYVYHAAKFRFGAISTE